MVVLWRGISSGHDLLQRPLDLPLQHMRLQERAGLRGPPRRAPRLVQRLALDRVDLPVKWGCFEPNCLRFANPHQSILKQPPLREVHWLSGVFRSVFSA